MVLFLGLFVCWENAVFMFICSSLTRDLEFELCSHTKINVIFIPFAYWIILIKFEVLINLFCREEIRFVMGRM